MKYVGITRASLLLVLLVLLLTLGLACGENPENIATKVAQEWTSSSIDGVSNSLGAAATGGIPGLQQVAASIIRDQIRQNVTWSYSKPSKVSEGRYEVVATATAPIDIKVLVLQLSYSLVGEFQLTVDTKDKKVIDWRLGAFRFTKL